MLLRTALVAVCLVAAVGAQKEPREKLPDDLKQQAKYQLYAAYGAYCKASKILAWDCKWCKDMGPAKVYGVVTNEQYDGQAYVVRNNQSMIIVSFRGSSNIENWVQDFTFDKIKLNWTGVPSGAEVHQGFYDSYMSMRTYVMNWVSQAQAECTTCKLHVTGHSLGAAEAQLCTMDFRLQGKDPMMWTFGQPRVGNEIYATFFDGKTNSSNPVYRMVNKRDVVPHLPPEELGFHHNAREVWQQTFDRGYIMCDNTGEDIECSDSVLLPETSIADHLDYMDTIESCDA